MTVAVLSMREVKPYGRPQLNGVSSKKKEEHQHEKEGLTF
jgi:hypothetical protein